MARTTDEPTFLSTVYQTLELSVRQRQRADCPTVWPQFQMGGIRKGPATPNQRPTRGCTARLPSVFVTTAGCGLGIALPSRLSIELSSPTLPALTLPWSPQNGCHLQQASHKHGGEILSWPLPLSTPSHCILLQPPASSKPSPFLTSPIPARRRFTRIGHCVKAAAAPL